MILRLRFPYLDAPIQVISRSSGATTQITVRSLVHKSCAAMKRRRFALSLKVCAITTVHFGRIVDMPERQTPMT
ncbi:MAG: hypothetical protein DMG72_05290 [Acidobacteria bacterium]|nr:MAG: hypothetical protein DMG72_05290 [Acidobacteriota bacterium]